MERKHRSILQRNHSKLQCSLAVSDDLLASLLSAEIIGSIEEKKKIKRGVAGTELPHNEQVDNVLHHVTRGGATAFKSFCAALSASTLMGNQELAKLLLSDAEGSSAATTTSPTEEVTSSSSSSSLPAAGKAAATLHAEKETASTDVAQERGQHDNASVPRPATVQTTSHAAAGAAAAAAPSAGELVTTGAAPHLLAPLAPGGDASLVVSGTTPAGERCAGKARVISAVAVNPDGSLQHLAPSLGAAAFAPSAVTSQSGSPNTHAARTLAVSPNDPSPSTTSLSSKPRVLDFKDLRPPSQSEPSPTHGVSRQPSSTSSHSSGWSSSQEWLPKTPISPLASSPVASQFSRSSSDPRGGTSSRVEILDYTSLPAAALARVGEGQPVFRPPSSPSNPMPAPPPSAATAASVPTTPGNGERRFTELATVVEPLSPSSQERVLSFARSLQKAPSVPLPVATPTAATLATLSAAAAAAGGAGREGSQSDGRPSSWLRQGADTAATVDLSSEPLSADHQRTVEDEMQAIERNARLLGQGGGWGAPDVTVKTLVENPDGTTAQRDENLRTVLSGATCTVFISKELLDETADDAPDAIMLYLKTRGIRRENTCILLDDDTRPVMMQSVSGQSMPKQPRGSDQVLVRVCVKVKLHRFYSKLVQQAVLQCLEEYVCRESIRVRAMCTGCTELLLQMSAGATLRLYGVAINHWPLLAGIGVISVAAVGRPVILRVMPAGDSPPPAMTSSPLLPAFTKLEKSRMQEILRRLPSVLCPEDVEEISSIHSYRHALMLCVQMVFNNPLYLIAIRMIVEGASHGEVDSAMFEWMTINRPSEMAQDNVLQVLEKTNPQLAMKIKKSEEVVAKQNLLRKQRSTSSAQESTPSPILPRMLSLMSQLSAWANAGRKWRPVQSPMADRQGRFFLCVRRHATTPATPTGADTTATTTLYLALQYPPKLYASTTTGTARSSGGSTPTKPSKPALTPEWKELKVPSDMTECCGLAACGDELYYVAYVSTDHADTRRSSSSSSPPPPRARNVIYRLDAALGKLSPVADGVSPAARHQPAVGGDLHRVYVLGGQDDGGRPSDTTSVYDLRARRWSTSAGGGSGGDEMPALPVACFDSHVTSLGNRDVLVSAKGGRKSGVPPGRCCVQSLSAGGRGPATPASAGERFACRSALVPGDVASLYGVASLGPEHLVALTGPASGQESGACSLFAYRGGAGGAGPVVSKLVDLPPLPEACFSASLVVDGTRLLAAFSRTDNSGKSAIYELSLDGLL